MSVSPGLEFLKNIFFIALSLQVLTYYLAVFNLKNQFKLIC